jgi:hypothetical protein
MIIATIGTRAHYLADLPAGVILAELSARLIFRSLERRRVWSNIRVLSAMQLASCVIVPLVLAAGLQHINTITGWGGVANMFSVTPTHPPEVPVM